MTERFRALRGRHERFLDERDWTDEHTPKNVAMSVAIEAAELMELLQWDDPSAGEIRADPERMGRIREEVADVIIYCMSLGISLDIDLVDAVAAKIEDNEERFDP